MTKNTPDQPAFITPHAGARLPWVGRYALHHVRAMTFCVAEIVRAPWLSLLTLLMMGLSLTFPLFFYWVLQNTRIFASQWQTTPHLTLYVKPMAQSQLQGFTDTVKRTPGITSVESISPQQGLSQLQKALNLTMPPGVFGENPLPTTLVITPSAQSRSPAKMRQLAQRFANNPRVNNVQLDGDWVTRLYFMLTLIQRISVIFIVLFALSILLLALNTIRLGIANQRETLMVLNLMGAPPAFVRRPLLYRGFLYGALSALVAWALMAACLLLLYPPAVALAASYRMPLPLHSLHWQDAIGFVAGSGALGWLGAYLASLRYLPRAC